MSADQAGRLDWHQSMLQTLAPYLSKGSTAIDIGANIGTHTSFYIECVGESGSVVAIEPHPEAFACLERNCPSAITRKMAIMDKRGSCELELDADSTGLSRVSNTGSGSVEVETLDHMLEESWFPKQEISFIKIDVEGVEPNVLMGGVETMRQCAPVVCVECYPKLLEHYGHDVRGIRSLLESMGYKEFLFYEPYKNWESDYFNVISSW